MNALAVIAACLVASAFIQWVGFYVYTAIYRKRYAQQVASENTIVQPSVFVQPHMSTRQPLSGKKELTGQLNSHKQTMHGSGDENTSGPFQPVVATPAKKKVAQLKHK